MLLALKILLHDFWLLRFGLCCFFGERAIGVVFVQTCGALQAGGAEALSRGRTWRRSRSRTWPRSRTWDPALTRWRPSKTSPPASDSRRSPCCRNFWRRWDNLNLNIFNGRKFLKYKKNGNLIFLRLSTATNWQQEVVWWRRRAFVLNAVVLWTAEPQERRLPPETGLRGLQRRHRPAWVGDAGS